MHASQWLAVGAGVALSAACGLRAFLPLLVLGLAARSDLVHLTPTVGWLAGDPALIALGVATVLEIAGDKIPVLDHALDAGGLLVRPAAAWLATYALLVHWPTPWGQIVALLLALMTLAIQGAKAKVRLGSTALTLGAANPVVSTIEDVLSLGMAAAGLVVPLLALAALVVLVFALRRRQAARVASSSGA
jgi:hypothetical protein